MLGDVVIVPLSGVTVPVNILSKVVLPAPLRPSRPMRWPRSIWAETPSNKGGPRNPMERSSIERMGIGATERKNRHHVSTMHVLRCNLIDVDRLAPRKAYQHDSQCLLNRADINLGFRCCLFARLSKQFCDHIFQRRVLDHDVFDRVVSQRFG